MKSYGRFGLLAMLVAVFVMAVPAAFAAAPQGVSPGAVDRMAAIRGECPTFSWSVVLSAEYFELVAYELPENIDLPADIALPSDRLVLRTRVVGNATGWTPELDQCFTPGGSYIWFVRAVLDDSNPAAVSEWSVGRFFLVASAPTAGEVARALDVLWRYTGGSDGDAEIIEGSRRNGRQRARSAGRQDPFREQGDPKGLWRTVPAAPAAIRGEMPDPTGETYGLIGVSHSPDGAGMGAANTVGGADLVLDGSAQGAADAELRESGIDRPSDSAEVFDISNSGVGSMTLLVDGVDVVTTATDRDTVGELSCAGGEVAKWNGAAWACAEDEDTAPRSPGNQLTLNGNALDVVEGSGSGLDADTVDGFGAAAFSPLVHGHDDRYFTETELSVSGAGGAVHWDNLGAMPAGFADGVDDDTTYGFGQGLTVINGQVVIDPSAFQTRITTLDSTGLVGSNTSIAIGADDLGLISYTDGTNYDLKVAHCNNTACTSASLSTLDSSVSVHFATSIAIGADGLGLISYLDGTNSDLKVAHCDNTACTSATLSTLDSAGLVGTHNSIAIGADGLGLISYFDTSNLNLKVAHCRNTACTSANRYTVDSTGNVGQPTSLAIGADGLGLIAYHSVTGFDLKVAHCNNTACSSVSTTIVDSVGQVGGYTSVAIGALGLGLISYYDETNHDLKVAQCLNIACTSTVITTLDGTGLVGKFTSVAIGADGFGLISYRDWTNYDLKVARCHNMTCTSATITAVDRVGKVGMFTSVAIGADGLGLISYYDEINKDLKVAHLGIGVP